MGYVTAQSSVALPHRRHWETSTWHLDLDYDGLWDLGSLGKLRKLGKLGKLWKLGNP